MLLLLALLSLLLLLLLKHELLQLQLLQLLLQSLVNIVGGPTVHNHVRLIVDGDHITIGVVVVKSSLLWIVRWSLTLPLCLWGFVRRSPILPEQPSEGVSDPTKVELLRLWKLLEGRPSQLV